jgi:hypothetical protein
VSPAQIAFQPYSHKSLELNTKQIRLIRVPHVYGTATLTEPLVCEMHTFELHSAPPFHALSYTWGKPLPPYPILVNPKFGSHSTHPPATSGLIYTGRNLDAFCREFRQVASNEALYIWVDQLCIDQKNILERNHQVQLMSRIYRRATSTIVWLDSEVSHDDDIDVAPTNASCVTAQDKQNPTTDTRLLRYRWHRKLHHDPPRQTNHPEILRSGLADTIVQHQYFSRLWIIQEILLARRVVFVVEGGIWAAWVEFYEQCAKSSVPIPTVLKAKNDSFATACEFGGIAILHSGHSLTMVIDAFCGQHCHNPKDKVYGLLGLVEEDQRPDIDYDRSVQDILLDVLRIALRDSSDRLRRRALLKLSKELQLGQAQQNGWHRFLTAIIREHDGRLRREKQPGEPWSRAPITGMGFMKGGLGSKKSRTGVDHWWYEAMSRRHEFECNLDTDNKRHERCAHTNGASTSPSERQRPNTVINSWIPPPGWI